MTPAPLIEDPAHVLALIAGALSRDLDNSDSPIRNVSYDNDHNSGEIILTFEDGHHSVDWVISSRDIRMLEPE